MVGQKRSPGRAPSALHHELMVHDPFMHRLVTDDRSSRYCGAIPRAQCSHVRGALYRQKTQHWPSRTVASGRLVLALGADGSHYVVGGWHGFDGWLMVVCGFCRGRTPSACSSAAKWSISIRTNTSSVSVSIPTISMMPTPSIWNWRRGNISIHHPSIIHGSNANTSDQWRVGLTLRYIPTSTKVTVDRSPCIMCRGEVVPEVGNKYAPRPQYVEGEHMPFAGCEDWSLQAAS